MQKKTNKNLITDILVVSISLIIFWSIAIPKLIDFKETMHGIVTGRVTGYEYNEKTNSYIYYTDLGYALNSQHYFQEPSILTINTGDYITKYPHSLDLIIVRVVTSDKTFRVQPRIFGDYKWFR